MINNRPLKLSVVVPSFNQGEFLDATLASLFTQARTSTDELEVVVMDAGSRDGTVSILKKWDSRIAYWVSAPDDGQTDALIRGFARCTGDVLGWLCSDDLLEPWTVREVMDCFRSTPGARFIYGDASWIAKNGAHLRNKYEIPFNWYIWLNDHNYIAQPSAFWTRDLYDEVGGLDGKYDLAMDAELFGRFAKATTPIHIARPWSRLRSHPEQKTQRMQQKSNAEFELIKSRLGMPVGNGIAAHLKHLTAKTWRVGWKLSRGAYS